MGVTFSDSDEIINPPGILIEGRRQEAQEKDEEKGGDVHPFKKSPKNGTVRQRSGLDLKDTPKNRISHSNNSDTPSIRVSGDDNSEEPSWSTLSDSGEEVKVKEE